MNRRNKTAWITALMLALLLPGLLVGGSAIFLVSGTVSRLRQEEVQAGRLALTKLRRSFLDRAATTRPNCPTIMISPQGQPTGPFVPTKTLLQALPHGDSPTPTTASIGLQFEARGEPRKALGFLNLAAKKETLSGEALLGRARCLAATGSPAEARRLLAESRGKKLAIPGTTLPFTLFADLLAARIAAEDQDPLPAKSLREQILTGKTILPAPAVGPILELLNRYLPDRKGERDRAFLAAAQTHLALEDGWLHPPDKPTVIPGGTLIVPLKNGGLQAIPTGEVADLLTRTLARINDQETGFHLTLEPTPKALANISLPGIHNPVFAQHRQKPTSARLEGFAHLLILVGLITFLAGCLLAIRLIRRELALSKLRMNFVDLVSHELRTPLTSLSLKAELLARNEVPLGKQDHYHKTLFTEVRKLSNLVNRILDFARLQKGRLPLEPIALPGRLLLAAAIGAGRESLALAKQRLHTNIPRHLPAVLIEREVMVRALRNLFENAARYAPEKSLITVTAKSSAGWLHIAIADEGPGVPTEERFAIFEPFRRGRARGTRNSSGSGLGLALVKQAVTAHKGRIKVEDSPTGGAIFTISLPLTPGEEDATTADH